MNKGNAGLLLQGVQVFHNGVLGLAHVDDHLGAAGQQRFTVHGLLAAVQLAQQGQIVVFRVQKLGGAVIPLVGNAHQQIGAQGEQDNLGHGAGDGHLGDVGRHRHRAAHAVGEFHRFSGNVGGLGGLFRGGSGFLHRGVLGRGLRLLRCRGGTAGQKQQGQKQGKNAVFHGVPPISGMSGAFKMVMI